MNSLVTFIIGFYIWQIRQGGTGKCSCSGDLIFTTVSFIFMVV